MNDRAAPFLEVAFDASMYRRWYDDALSNAQYAKRQLEQILIVPRSGNGAMDGILAARVRDRINAFARAASHLDRTYLNLCDVMEWDDDDAKDAGVTVRGLRLARHDDDLARED